MASSSGGTLVRKVLLQLSADDGDTEAKLDAITAKAKELGELHPELQARIDTAAASAKVAVLKQELTDLAKAKVEIEPVVDDTEALAEIEELRGATEDLKDSEIVVTMNDDGPLVQIRQIKTELDELAEPGVTIDPVVDIEQAEAKTEALKLDLDAIKSPVITPKVEDDPAKAKIDELQRKIDVLTLQRQRIKIDADAGPAEIKIAGLEAQLKELSESSGKESGEGFSGGFSEVFSNPYVITGAIMAALAALPALAAAGGALAGIALAGALLVGTSSVKGPLYSQFHDMTDGIMSVLRTAALPLVKPLGEAFAQIGQFAKQLYPVLRQVFASLGPDIAPLTRGLEGLVSGILPGFLRLMQASRPAVQAVAQLMSQLGSSLGGTLGTLASGVKSSSQFISGLSGIISNILPIVGNLATLFAGALGPVMQQIGQQLAPLLARGIDEVLQRVAPLMPQISQLAGELIVLGDKVLNLATGPLGSLGMSLINMAVKWLPAVIPPIETLVGYLNNLASVAETTLSILSHIPGLGFLNPGSGPVAAQLNPVAAGGASAFTAASTAAAADYGSSWAGGATSVPAVNTAAQAAAQKQEQEMVALSHQLTGSFAESLADTKSAGAVQGGVNKLLADVTTSWQDGIITLSKDDSLTKWINAQGARLGTLANQQGKLESEIATAKKYAASTASSVYSNYDLSSVAGSGTSTLGIPALKGALSADLAQIRQFSANITKLSKMGLNKGYISQLISMGPVNGGELANELASSGVGDIKQINAAEYAISEASGQLGQASANAMYDTGANAGKGFLSGLESQESAISKVMTKIAKSMVGTVKTELGIHSPSTVGHEIGANFGGSVGTGLETRIATVAESSRKLTQAMTAGAAARPAGGSAAAAAAGQQKVVIQITGDKNLRTWLKKSIRVTGGQVEVVGA